MASDASVIFNILANDKTGPTFAKVAAEAAILGKSINRSMSASTNVDHNIFRRSLMSLTSLGAEIGTGLMKEMSKTMAALGPGIMKAAFTKGGGIGIAIAAIIVEAAAPIIAGGIGAAITLGVGGAFLALGALVLKNNKRIVSAFGQLKKDIMSTLQGAAQPLITPFVQAMGLVGKFFKGNAATFKKIFQSLAPSVVPLTNAILSMVNAFTPGLVKLAQTFTDIMKDPSTAHAIWGIGNSLNTVFVTISHHKGMIVLFFKALAASIATATYFLNVFFGAAEQVYREMALMIKGGQRLGHFFSTTLPGLFRRGWNAIKSGASSAYHFILDKFNQIRNGITSKVSSIIHTIKGIPGRIKRALGNLGGLLWGAGRAVVQGLINGILSKLGSLGSALGRVGSFIKDHKGPESKDKVLLKPAGKLIMSGLISGMESQFGAIHNSLSGLTESLPRSAAPVRSGGGRQKTEIVLSGDTPAIRALISMLAAEVRGSYNGDVQVALGGRR